MEQDNKLSYKNPEGYADPTPYSAIRNIEYSNRDSADVNAYRLIKCLLILLDINGYELIGRLHLRDKTTGREYK